MENNDIENQLAIFQSEENDIASLEQTEAVKSYLLKVKQHNENIESLKAQLKEYMIKSGQKSLTDATGQIKATISFPKTVEVEDISKIEEQFFTLEPLDTSNLVFDGDDIYTKTPNTKLAKSYADIGTIPNGFVKRDLTPRFSLKINGKTI